VVADAGQDVQPLDVVKARQTLWARTNCTNGTHLQCKRVAALEV